MTELETKLSERVVQLEKQLTESLKSEIELMKTLTEVTNELANSIVTSKGLMEVIKKLELDYKTLQMQSIIGKGIH